ncbi:MAG: hypothetical protein J07HR59_00693 [Halorubrum sp. J07HR59]|nr:MAG: hypothetical protein J07HR59_00693 [Halorubrum sp. J07HR59]
MCVGFDTQPPRGPDDITSRHVVNTLHSQSFARWPMQMLPDLASDTSSSSGSEKPARGVRMLSNSRRAESVLSQISWWPVENHHRNSRDKLGKLRLFEYTGLSDSSRYDRGSDSWWQR